MGDGDLDIIFTGTSRSGTDIFEVYENRLEEGAISFVNVDVDLDRISESKLDLGDFNGDGYTDLLYSGVLEGVGGVTNLAEFDPTTKDYSTSDFDVSGVLNAEVEFGDLDGDGDLDFMLTGQDSEETSQNNFDIYLNVRNESAEVQNESSGARVADLLGSNGTFSVNERPSPPSVLNDPVIEEIEENMFEVTFDWEPGSDDSTPSEGLTYAIKVGTSEGG